MKFRTLLLVGVLTTGPVVAYAQESSGEKDRPKRPGQLQRQGGPARGEGRSPELMARGAALLAKNMPVMIALDLDGDGQLSASEIEKASKSLIKLDKNGDGILSAEELQPEPGPWMNMVGGPGGPRGPGGPGAGGPGAGMPGNPAMLMRMFENRDKNGDGKLSGDEIPEQMRGRIGMLDENGDGAIDRAEIEKMRGRLEGRGGNRADRPTPGGQGVPPQRPPRGEKKEDSNKEDDKK